LSVPLESSEGLIAALEKQAAALYARHEIRVNTELCDVESPMSPETKEALYRIRTRSSTPGQRT